MGDLLPNFLRAVESLKVGSFTFLVDGPIAQNRFVIRVIVESIEIVPVHILLVCYHKKECTFLDNFDQLSLVVKLPHHFR